VNGNNNVTPHPTLSLKGRGNKGNADPATPTTKSSNFLPA